MAIEPVNERPIFPSLTRLDALGVSHWSTSMIRQLTTVFQQYGYKLNQSLMGEDLTQNDGTVPEVDQNSVWTAEQVFWNTGTASTSANGIRFYNETADVAWLFRKDHLALYLLRSDTDEPGDNWDAYRPLRFDDATGAIELNFGTGASEGVAIGSPSGGLRGQGSLALEELYVDGPTNFAGVAQGLQEDANVGLLRGGRSSDQYLTFTGSAAGNYLRSVSLTNNAKYLRLNATTDASDTSPSAGQCGIRFETLSTIRVSIEQNGSVVVGSPSGGAKGSGTINAQAVYDDNTLLTDYVFDAELDGDIDVDAYDESTEEDEFDEDGNVIGKRRRTHRPARDFKRNMSECSPGAFAAKWRQSRKLPAVARAPSKPSVGELTQALLETCEVQAIHIAKLEERISALEANNGSSTPKKPRSPTDS